MDRSCVQRYCFHGLPTDDETKRAWLEKKHRKDGSCAHFISWGEKKPTEENLHPPLWLGYERQVEKIHWREGVKAVSGDNQIFISGVQETEYCCIFQ